MQDARESPRIFQHILLSQGPITEAITARGYNITPNGVCFGLTQMAIDESLAVEEGLEKYLQRLAKITYFISIYGSLEKFIAKQEEIKIRAELKKDISTLALINKNLWEIQAFLDGVTLYQSPARYSALFTPKISLHQSAYPAKKILTSVNMQNRNQTIVTSPPFIALYTQTSFSAFINKVKKYFNNIPFCIEINTQPHQSTLVFDPKIGRLVLVDPNAYSLIWQKSDISEQVFSTFPTRDACMLSLRVRVNSKYKDNLQTFCAKKNRPSIPKTMSKLSVAGISCLVSYHMRAGNIAAIKTILAYIRKDTNPVKKSKVILDMLNAAIARDASVLIPMLLPLIVKPEELHTPTKYIASKFTDCLSLGAVKCAQYFLEQYPSLLAYRGCLALGSSNTRSLEFLLNRYSGNREAEKIALYFKTNEGHDALFLSIPNSAAFAILLKKYMEFPEFITDLPFKIDCVSLLEELIKHPHSLGIFLETAASDTRLNQAICNAMELLALENGHKYTGTILHKSLAYPASFRALIAFSAQQHRSFEHIQLLDSAKYAMPYFPMPPGTALPTADTSLMELFLADRQLVRFILKCYPLKEQMAILSLKIQYGASKIFLFEADCFSEKFKIKVRLLLGLKNAHLSKLPPFSVDNIYKKDEVDVPHDFVCLFENALANPDEFKTLISSIPEEVLYERVRFSIDGNLCLLRRSLESPECFRHLLYQLKDVPELINSELLIACFYYPASLEIFLQHISSKTLFNLISEKISPFSLKQAYPSVFPIIWAKLYRKSTSSATTQGFFGSVPAKDTVTSEIKDIGPSKVSEQDSPKAPDPNSF